MGKPLIIEFTGVPGCGKTTLVLALKESLNKEGKVTYTLGDIYQWYQSLTFLQKIPIYLKHFFLFTSLTNKAILNLFYWRSRHTVTHQFLWIITFPVLLQAFIKRHQPCILLLDEGLVNWYAGWAISSNKSIIPKLITKTFPEYDRNLWVYLETDLWESYNRIVPKNNPGTSISKIQSNFEFYQQFNESLQQIIKHLKGQDKYVISIHESTFQAREKRMLEMLRNFHLQ